MHSSSHQPAAANAHAYSAAAQRSTEILVGVLVPPVLVGLVVARAVAHGLAQAGLVSEQLLQGQRLPNLNVHPTHSE